MSQHTPHNPPTAGRSRCDRRRLLGWSCGGIVVVTLIAAGAVDARLKSHRLVGRYPVEAEWVVAAADFGQAWRAFEETEYYSRLQPLQTELPLHPFNELYKRTGIRLSPGRWNRWLGPKCVLAGRGLEWGLCVRPGLLGRLAMFGRRLGDSDTGAVQPYGQGYLAWRRDGFLIYASSEDLIADWLADSAREVGTAPMSAALHVLTGTERGGDFTLSFDGGVHVEGRLAVDVSPRERPLSLPNAWPGQPLVTFSGSQWSEVIEWLPEKGESAPIAARIREQIETWSRLAPEEWNRDQDEYSAALLALDDSQFLVVPEILFMTRSSAPIDLPEASLSAVQYEWNGYPGWLEPWHGEKFSMYVAADNRTRFVANQEPIMARHVGRLRRGPLVDADLVIEVDLAALCAALKPVFARAGEYELLPRMNAVDVDEYVLPWLDAVALGGRLRLAGIATTQGLRITGEIDPATLEQDGS